jgi:hypothetical protein
MGRNFTDYGSLFFAVGNKNVSSLTSEAWGELMGCTCLYAYLMISLVHHFLDCSAYWNIKAHVHVQMWKSKCARPELSLVVSCWIFCKIKGVFYTSNLPISRIHAFGIWISDIYFNFVMLCHWLASQEGFSIGWWQVLRTCLNSYKNATKLKSQSPNVAKNFPSKFCKVFLREKMRILWLNIPF